MRRLPIRRQVGIGDVTPALIVAHPARRRLLVDVDPIVVEVVVAGADPEDYARRRLRPSPVAAVLPDTGTEGRTTLPRQEETGGA